MAPLTSSPSARLEDLLSRILLPLFSLFTAALTGFQESFLAVLRIQNEEKTDQVEFRGNISVKKEPGAAQAIGVKETILEYDGKEPISQYDDTVTAIMDVIETFSLHQNGDEWLGRAVFSPRIRRHVSAGRKIPMVLPAFPAKSIKYEDKVLGPLPDLGEELAMDRINDLCQSIQRVYEPGAMVLIATDGPCYNDLTGVTENNLWEYGVKVREMVAAKGYTCIEFIDTVNLFGLSSDSEMTKEKFKSLLEPTRRELERRYGDPDFDASACIKNDPDYKMTYDGYAKFLKKDLALFRSSVPSGKKYKSLVHETAKSMIARGVAFAKLIREKYPEHVRLSIHPSTGRTKVSMPLIPVEGSFSMTPWHSVVVVDEHGKFRTTHVAGLRRTHDLVYKHGRPYYFRTRSPLYQFEAKVELEHLYGGGLIIHNAGGAGQTKSSLTDSDKDKIASLAVLQGNCQVKGFL